MSLFTQMGGQAWADSDSFSCPTWHKTKQLEHSCFLLRERARQHHSLGNSVRTNKAQSCSLWGLACPACCITITEQGARQGSRLRWLHVPCSLGRQQGLRAQGNMVCQGIQQYCWTHWDALQVVTAMGVRQWTLDWFLCRRKLCKED